MSSYVLREARKTSTLCLFGICVPGLPIVAIEVVIVFLVIINIVTTKLKYKTLSNLEHMCLITDKMSPLFRINVIYNEVSIMDLLKDLCSVLKLHSPLTATYFQPPHYLISSHRGSLNLSSLTLTKDKHFSF